MSLGKGATVTDALEAIRALREELASVKNELVSCKSDVSRLNRNNTHLVVENKSLKAEVARLKAEIEELGGSKVEKDSTNSSVPPTQQSIAGQAALRTRSLREPSGRRCGGQKGHAGHQVCLAHLLRNLQYLCDINKQQQWAGSVQELLRDAIHTWKQSKCGVPGTEVRKSFEKRMDRLLDEDVGHYGKEFQTLQNGMILCKDYLFTFLDHEGVPPHKGGVRDVDNIVEGTTAARGQSES